MNLVIAAIRSGTDPIGKLPEAAFHRWLDSPLGCPKCEVTYNLVVDWDKSNNRWFEDESRGLIRLLQKAIQLGHSSGHRVSHFETSGVVVRSFTVPVNIAEGAGRR